MCFYLAQQLQTPVINTNDLTTSSTKPSFDTTKGNLVTRSGSRPMTYRSLIGSYITPEVDKSLWRLVFTVLTFSPSWVGIWHGIPFYMAPNDEAKMPHGKRPLRANEWTYRLEILKINQTQVVLPCLGVTSPWHHRKWPADVREQRPRSPVPEIGLPSVVQKGGLLQIQEPVLWHTGPS